MARTDLSIPSLGNKFVDIRETIPGDSFNWSWVRSLSQVNYLAIHHTAGPDTQTPDQIANFHIQSNGWGGIGYHFLIGKDGTVFYVGDISTARANVANINEQVLGICLIGNFTSGRVPSNAQLDSAHNLCEFFIGSYPNLSNVDSWDDVKGHKELPGQSTVCPGDEWPSWRSKIVGGGIIYTPPVPPPVPQPPPPSLDRGAQITAAYRTVLGREPDMGGLQTYTNGPMSMDEILKSMVSSEEHIKILERSKETESLKSQVDNLQTSQAFLNQQVISLQETVQAKDRQINDLGKRLNTASTATAPLPTNGSEKMPDHTLTIFQALFNLYKFIFLPRKDSLDGTG